MAKKALISGYIGFGNFGDEVVLSILVKHLRAKGISITALSSNPKMTSKVHGIEALRYKNLGDILRGVGECDVLFSGGGSLLQNFTSNLSLYYYLTIIVLALIMRKKVIVFAQGIGPIKGFFSTLFTKLVLRQCDIITTRDADSQHTLRRWGLQSSLECDPVWTLTMPEYKPEPVLGVQIRPYAAMNKFFLERLADAISLYFRNKKVQIFSFQNELDSSKCYEFQALLKSKGVSSEVIVRTHISDILNDFSKLEYLIAMRFHACLLGLKMGIKTLPVAYDVKIEALARELGLKLIYAYDDVDFTGAVEEFTRYEENTLTAQKRTISFDWSGIDAVLDEEKK